VATIIITIIIKNNNKNKLNILIKKLNHLLVHGPPEVNDLKIRNKGYVFNYYFSI
jgi:hypothetical protein